MSGQRQVVIVGAGVIGLTIAHVLCTRSPGQYNITIVARDMPEDLLSQQFASPWAGANWSPFTFEEKAYKRELLTFNKFWDMEHTGLVHIAPYTIYYDTDNLEDLWYKDLVREFRVLSTEEVGGKTKAGVYFKTITVNPVKYLPWLKSEVEVQGVKFVRQKLQSIEEAADIAGKTGLVVNATGLGAKSLIGVEDNAVFPIRGQTMVIHAPDYKECMSIAQSATTGVVSPDGTATYIIPRPSPHGHVLLGGTYQKHNWDLSVNFDTAKAIWEQCTEIVPALKTASTKVVSHNVGLRPAREGGPRIELEWVQLPLKREFMHGHGQGAERECPVVHCYGFGGTGYQGSWGAAEEAVDLIQSAFSK